MTQLDLELARARVLQRWRLRCATMPQPTPGFQRLGAGNFKPGVILLVGERTSHPEQNKLHAPFCSVKACSGWLNTLLARSSVPEEALFWINALDNDGSEVALESLAAELRPRAIIALGNVAQRCLHKRSLVHYHVPHPQYWKRFKNKETYPLLPLLTELYDDTNSNNSANGG